MEFTDMRVPCQVGHIRLKRRLSDHLEFGLEGLMGKRLYNEAFT